MRHSNGSAHVTGLALITLLLTVGMSASTLNVLYTFTGNGDGRVPNARLVRDSSGNLYGTTFGSGAPDLGNVFELSLGSNGNWTETVLYSFLGGNDGCYPITSVIFDKNGDLFGTTQGCGVGGNGTVFELTPNSGGGWTESVLYSFKGNSDGATPTTGHLIFDKSGDLCGMTQFGGANNAGTVFELSNNSGIWTETILYSFGSNNNNDGSNPISGLIFDSAGNLYGTTYNGGSCALGIVFRLKPNGGIWQETVLHNFCGGQADGASPLATPLFDNSGNLYGTTAQGGTGKNSGCFGRGCGAVYKLSVANNWHQSLLYSFGGGIASPWGLTKVGKNSFYGTTAYGGTYAEGSIFRVQRGTTGKWTGKTLYSFTNGSDGSSPLGNLLLVNGEFYGTARFGGTFGDGVVFQFQP